MNRHSIVDRGVVKEPIPGHTLPLFGNTSQGNSPVASKSYASTSSEQDPHMQAAWRLSRILLQGVKNGHGVRVGKAAGLSPNQRHQLGNAICEHLLASLREQVNAEQSQSRETAAGH